MPNWNEYGCANCGAELDPGKAPERREVPRRGGRNLPVCDQCAREIGAQTTLADEGVEGYERVRSIGIAILDLGEIYPEDRCVWCGQPERKEKLRGIVVKATMARAVECDNTRRCMQRRRAQAA